MNVSGLFVYPVKSLRGIALERSAVGPWGLRHDRRWMVVDENGRFRTQRQIAKMARVATALDGALVLSTDGGGAVEAPLEAAGDVIEVSIWNWTGPAQLVDPTVDRWLTDVLGMPCRLVAMLDGATRTGWGGSPIAFPDGGATLVVGEASLAALNSRLDAPVPMDRFRANVVLAGTEPYAEDEWACVQIGEVRLRFAKRCGRCVVTTADQRTGERTQGDEPLWTLARERRFDGNACFGSFYAPQDSGQITVGDSVRALSETENYPFSSGK